MMFYLSAQHEIQLERVRGGMLSLQRSLLLFVYVIDII